jgi:hypothetical protein
MTDDLDGLGPVQFMIVKFPGSRFTGAIVPALRELVDSGTVRIIDLGFVTKSDDGDITVVEVAQLPDEAAGAFAELQFTVSEIVSNADLEGVGEVIEPGSSAAILVWEDTWATKLASALRAADAEILELTRVPREIVEESIRLVREANQGA